MSIFSSDIYERIRTRVIVVHAGMMLLLPPDPDDDGAWHPPGGGLMPDESLAECAAREVLEETGVRVDVGHVAFTREWVAPKYCTPDELGEGPGYGLEVFYYAVPAGATTPRPETRDLPCPSWVPLSDVPSLRLWPNELKSLSLRLQHEPALNGAPWSVTDFVDPSTPPQPVEWQSSIRG